jgi:3-methyladenine DNA glycosylase AlkD
LLRARWWQAVTTAALFEKMELLTLVPACRPGPALTVRARAVRAQPIDPALPLGRLTDLDPDALATEIDRRIRTLPTQTIQPIRAVRRAYSKRLRAAPAEVVATLAVALVDRQRWVAYELLYHHPGGLASLGVEDLERLGRGMQDWGSVDAFGCYISGPAWQQGKLPDAVIHRWAASPDRWWRRAALVSTVPLNLRSRGGTGDTKRTLDICQRLVADRDDMVVKALSWALRQLVVWDPEAVRRFLEAHDEGLAPRVRREVRNKLDTGLKNASRRATQPRSL